MPNRTLALFRTLPPLAPPHISDGRLAFLNRFHPCEHDVVFELFVQTARSEQPFSRNVCSALCKMAHKRFAHEYAAGWATELSLAWRLYVALDALYYEIPDCDSEAMALAERILWWESDGLDEHTRLWCRHDEEACARARDPLVAALRRAFR